MTSLTELYINDNPLNEADLPSLLIDRIRNCKLKT
jgi:hypothetical protein